MIGDTPRHRNNYWPKNTVDWACDDCGYIGAPHVWLNGEFCPSCGIIYNWNKGRETEIMKPVIIDIKENNANNC